MADKTCPRCGGSGRDGSCGYCYGKGITWKEGDHFSQSCSYCNGTGKKECSECRGRGTVYDWDSSSGSSSSSSADRVAANTVKVDYTGDFLIEARGAFEFAVKKFEQVKMELTLEWYAEAIGKFEEAYKIINGKASYASSNSAYSKDLQKRIEDNDYLKLIHSYVMRGVIAHLYGDANFKKTAINDFNKAIELSEKLAVKPYIIAEAYHWRAVIKGPQDSSSREDFKNSIIYGIDKSDKKLAAISYASLGFAYKYADKNKDLAYACLKRVVDLNCNSSVEASALEELTELGYPNYTRQKYEPLKSLGSKNTTSSYLSGIASSRPSSSSPSSSSSTSSSTDGKKKGNMILSAVFAFIGLIAVGGVSGLVVSSNTIALIAAIAGLVLGFIAWRYKNLVLKLVVVGLFVLGFITGQITIPGLSRNSTRTEQAEQNVIETAEQQQTQTPAPAASTQTQPAQTTAPAQPAAAPVAEVPASRAQRVNSSATTLISAYDQRTMIDQEFQYLVTGTTSNGTVWGTGPYLDSSNIAMAAVHAGKIKDGETGWVTIRITARENSYPSGSANGVSTTAQAHPGSSASSFIFVD